MGTCKKCGKSSILISNSLPLCIDCIRESSLEEIYPFIYEAHSIDRRKRNLPVSPPRAENAPRCTICSNKCAIPKGYRGFCGIRRNENGVIKHPPKDVLLSHNYLDPHVTNCCAAWFCPAGTGIGYPKYAYSNTPEYGYYNYAIFLYGCNFDCLFCQNYTHKNIERAPQTTFQEILRDVENPKISCICFFGGSPEPQLPSIISLLKQMREEHPHRILRFCFEWNGCGSWPLVKKAGEYSYLSGGIIKFDLKAYTSSLSLALSGVDNSEAYRNFKRLFETFGRREKVPFLTATTLLVPGYVDNYEVDNIASFIAEMDPEIPYSLLIFHPEYLMSDLPITPREQVFRCYRAAKRHLKNVNIGNMFLLSLA